MTSEPLAADEGSAENRSDNGPRRAPIRHRIRPAKTLTHDHVRDLREPLESQYKSFNAYEFEDELLEACDDDKICCPECDGRLAFHGRWNAEYERNGRPQPMSFLKHKKGTSLCSSTPATLARAQRSEIVRWIRAQHPDALIELDSCPWESDARPDIAAVIGAGLGAENRLAFELQTSALDGGSWAARHDQHAEHEVCDIWLFNENSSHYKVGDSSNPIMQLTATTETVAGRDLPIRWLRSDAGRLYVRTGWVHRNLITDYPRPLTTEFAEDELETCSIKDGAFIAPNGDALVEELRGRRAPARRPHERVFNQPLKSDREPIERSNSTTPPTTPRRSSGPGAAPLRPDWTSRDMPGQGTNHAPRRLRPRAKTKGTWSRYNRKVHVVKAMLRLLAAALLALLYWTIESSTLVAVTMTAAAALLLWATRYYLQTLK